MVPQFQDLTTLNTLGLFSHAGDFIKLTSLSQLEAISSLNRAYKNILILGGGSNLILPEKVDKLVIQVALPGIKLIEARPDAWIVQAGAGVSWHYFVSTCLKHGWDGLENLALIPGTVGASVVQNVGAYGLELSDRFLELTAWDIYSQQLVKMNLSDCRYAYRDSFFKRSDVGRWLITAVRFILPRPWKPVISYPDLHTHPSLLNRTLTANDVFGAVCSIRRRKLPDPSRIGNVGSFFKNLIVGEDKRNDLCKRFPNLPSYLLTGNLYKLDLEPQVCLWLGLSISSSVDGDTQRLPKHFLVIVKTFI